MSASDSSALRIGRSTSGVSPEAEWHGPGARKRPKHKFRWSRLLWALVWPRGGERIVPTVPGVVLIGLSFGLGTAAYNSSSNILFITLSLLLACLILSGVLSWLNVRRVVWRLELAPPWRAGHVSSVGLTVQNRKTVLPTYGLWFEFAAKTVASGAVAVESTIMGKGIDVRAALKKANAAEARGSVALGGRLDPRGETRIEWSFTPQKRGRLRVELSGVGSLFPFGFLKKLIGAELRAEAVVWPAPVEYRRFVVSAAQRTGGGERMARFGSGGDLLSLRRYAPGDSHRLIHWKATARTQQLLVRQFSAESSEGLAVWLQTGADAWRPEQFELLVSFAATLVEDLFRAGRLDSVALNGETLRTMRHGRDLEAFLDRLAVVEGVADSGVVGVPAPRSGAMAGESTRPTNKSMNRRNVLTFAPDGTHGVAAYIDGNKAASA